MGGHAAPLALALLWPDSSSLKDLLPLFTALVGVGATLLGLLLGPQLNRRVAKKGPKTELRARAYGDFVAYHLRPGPRAGGGGAPDPDANDVLARLLVFGESNVISAAATFLRTREQGDLANVIVEMRASVLTGRAEAAVKTALGECASRALPRPTGPQ